MNASPSAAVAGAANATASIPPPAIAVAALNATVPRHLVHLLVVVSVTSHSLYLTDRQPCAAWMPAHHLHRGARTRESPQADSRYDFW
ncbi:hypothetical protein GCM10011490_22070 [Pseudoclavibacter endophyticus]|nr:hypothetical protein GCM10011490_22070 [Pseudoclavibacter endophyticus]